MSGLKHVAVSFVLAIICLSSAPAGADQSLQPSPIIQTVPDVNMLADGDLIFQESQSPQAPALYEATGSAWTHMGVIVRVGTQWRVAEASKSVTLSPLADFIKKGRKSRYSIRRVRSEVLTLDSAAIEKLKQELIQFGGRPYDILFQWDDQAIYCSELVWKAFNSAFGISIGSVQKFSDLQLDGPAVKKLIRDRYVEQGLDLNLSEPIVTPIEMLNSPLLFEVVSSQK